LLSSDAWSISQGLIEEHEDTKMFRRNASMSRW